MLRPRVLLLLFLLLLSITWISSSGVLKRYMAGWFNRPDEINLISVSTLQKLQGKAFELKKFVEEKGYNNRVCFLVDMSLPSGRNRFFVYDMKKDTLQNSGLVTHGRCNQKWLEGRKYGNTVGCGCSSIGKYRIGKKYNGKFRTAFKLHGLEKSNDKAFERFVVLHSHECVPETAVRNEICQSDGCPTVAPGFLQQLQPIITNSRKPVLLWVFE